MTITELCNVARREQVDAGWPEREFLSDLMLIVTELAEASEGERKDLMDDKLPHRKMVEVEIADAFIRLAALAGKHELDVAGAIIEKMEYNRHREDHKLETRELRGGKKW
jgi:NTP pyrophosphatase (non-canonical NTP hydrolase)